MNIAVLGGGIEGRSLIRYFLKKKATVTLCDQKEIDLQNIGFSGIQTRFGGKYLEGLEKFNLVFRSPGIPFLTPAIQQAIQRGAKITSLTKYFFEKCPAKIIGVTGTKGKGTTASLLYEILKKHFEKSKIRVFLGGNIGKTPLDFLDGLKSNDIVILELSSFQLQDLGQSPPIAIVLSITEDHLDYHKTMGEYIEAKQNIVRYQKPGDTAIIPIDSIFDNLPAKNVLKISVKNPFMKIQKTNLLGKHNETNILMAAAAAKTLGIPDDFIRHVAENFRALPHRLEFILEINGVKFYNDSASTNADTTIAALQSFTQPLILIAGGSEKFVHYGKLGEEIVRRINVKTVVLMGKTSRQIEEAVDRASERLSAEMRKPRAAALEVIKADGYQEAFMAAKLLAKKGDIVLLSPASASFDMFANYQERGEIFKAFVKSMTQ